MFLLPIDGLNAPASEPLIIAISRPPVRLQLMRSDLFYARHPELACHTDRVVLDWARAHRDECFADLIAELDWIDELVADDPAAFANELAA